MAHASGELACATHLGPTYRATPCAVRDQCTFNSSGGTLDVDNDIDVSVDDGRLTVSGSRSTDRNEERDGVFLVERRTGSFSRSMSLPDGVDPDSVRADYTDGILSVRVPLPQDERTARPRHVEIAHSEPNRGTTDVAVDSAGSDGSDDASDSDSDASDPSSKNDASSDDEAGSKQTTAKTSSSKKSTARKAAGRKKAAGQKTSAKKSAAKKKASAAS